MQLAPIVAKLGALRRRMRLLLVVNGAIMCVLVGGGLTIASFGLDWLFQFPIGARAVVLCLMLGTMCWGSWRFFLVPSRVPLPDDDLALLVQRRHPQHGDRLISALQLGRSLDDAESTESRELIMVAVTEAAARFSGQSFNDATSVRGLMKPAALAFAALTVIGGYSAALPQHLSVWVDRCLLLRDRPWPPKTRLEVTIANIEKYRSESDGADTTLLWVPEHSVLRIDVKAFGDVPAAVQLKKFVLPRESNPDPITIDMPARPGLSEFEYKFGRVTASFEFYVEGGDDVDESPYFKVMVRAAPRVNELVVDYDFPLYVNDTGEQDKKGVREYNVVGPEGTRVTMRFITSGDIARFDVIQDEDADHPLRLQPVADSPTDFEWSFALERDHMYTYKLVGENGAPSREEASFNISSQPDLPPQIGIVLPETTSLDVTASAMVPLAFQVSDDWRVGTVAFRFDTSRDGPFTNRREILGADRRERSQAREVATFQALELKNFTTVDEGQVRPMRAGDVVYLQLEASDTRVTTAHPAPNLSHYPTLIALNVREPAEIERELTRTQLRLKDQVRRAEELARSQVEALEKLSSMLIGNEGETLKVDGEMHGLVAAQDLVTSSLQESARGFVRVLDGYVFNRMEASNFCEDLLARLCEAHRRDDGTHYEFLSRILPDIRPRINDSELIGKLARIMDLMILAADRNSPTVSQALKSGVDKRSIEERRAALIVSLDLAKRLHTDLLALCEKMEEWEDFQDVVQSLRDLIEAQKGIAGRMKSIAPK